MTQAVAEVERGLGYVLGPAPADAEVAWLRGFVEAKWRRVLTQKYPALAETIVATPITDYHKIAHLIDHAATWVKDARLFTVAEVGELTQQLSLFRFLGEAFGPYEIADIEGLGHPEIYWRLVRPNRPDDVAGAHADAWFYTLTNHLPEEQQKRITKVWFPVFSQPGLSGISVAAGSQKMNLAYTGEMRHGRMKPLMIDPRAGEVKLSPLPLSPGQCVAFNVGLLHQGIGHSTDQCRVSIEFAIRRA
jgi:hypothetical protein